MNALLRAHTSVTYVIQVHTIVTACCCNYVYTTIRRGFGCIHYTRINICTVRCDLKTVKWKDDFKTQGLIFKLANANVVYTQAHFT